MTLDLQPIIERKLELERVIEELTRRIANAPPGHLVISKQKKSGSVKYYQKVCGDGGEHRSSKKSYIHKTDLALIKALGHQGNAQLLLGIVFNDLLSSGDDGGFTHEGYCGGEKLPAVQLQQQLIEQRPGHFSRHRILDCMLLRDAFEKFLGGRVANFLEDGCKILRCGRKSDPHEPRGNLRLSIVHAPVVRG